MKIKKSWQTIIKAMVTAVLIIIIIPASSLAQHQLLEECASIKKYYQQTPRLSFELRYTYAKASHPTVITDSAWSAFEIDGSRYRMLMNDAEFMQNDSFRISVLGPERVLNIGSPHSGAMASLPIDQWDSLFQNNDFSFSLAKEGNNKKLTVSYAKVANSFFKKMEVWYELASNRINHIRYTVDESVFDPSLVEEGMVSGEEMIVDIAFSNYQTGRFTKDIFNSANYFSKSTAEYLPAPAYAGFEVFVSSPALYN